jgi:hypothetical protein
MDSDQTKHIRHYPWCGHGTYVLGWGVIKPQAMGHGMVGAKAARHHGDAGLPQYLCHVWGFWTWYDSS